MRDIEFENKIMCSYLHIIDKCNTLIKQSIEECSERELRKILRDVTQSYELMSGSKISTERSIGTKLRFYILQRDNFTCRYCGRKSPEVKLHVDHITPWSLGGQTVENNLTAACVDCNLGKSNLYNLGDEG